MDIDTAPPDNASAPARDRSAPAPDGGLGALAQPALEPAFWPAERLGTPSAWWQHVPFAHWIVANAAPRTVVELGTHAGVSYAAFCQAVVRSAVEARCYAVDTWRGDSHAGEYGDEVFDEFRAYHDERFAGFSALLRCSFDEALGRFAEGSIDLLHIDGLHTYDAVRHDFESWKPKLSERGVVLFHDTNVRTGDFGVWRLWEELRREHPNFEFLHGHGLGVLAVGGCVPSAVGALCALGDPAEVAAVRRRFAALGERGFSATRERMLGQEIGRQATAAAERARADERGRADRQIRTETGMRLRAAARTTEARKEAFEARARQHAAAAEADALRAALQDRERMRAGLEREAQGLLAALQEREAMRAALEQERAVLEGKAGELRALLEQERAALRRAAAERDGVLQSTAWRATGAIRRLGGRMPDGVRRALRGGAKLGWWSLTMRLPRRLRERRAAIDAPAAAARTVEEAPHAAPPTAAPPAVVGAAADAPGPAPVRDAQEAAPPRAASGGRLRGRTRVVFVSGEHDTPGHLYRVVRPAAAAASVGAETDWMRPDEIPCRLDEVRAADVLWIWRASWSDGIASAAEAARGAGARVVFDVDDLMVDPGLARCDVIDGIRSQDLTEDMVRDHYSRIRATMAAADLCLAPTEELAAHMRQAGMPARVLPNGFDHDTFATSRLAARRRAVEPPDGLVRIGYAGGSRTHQRDFALCAHAVAAALRAQPECRLVAFRSPDGTRAILDVEEFPAFRGLEDRIEWRNFVPLERLPDELARFDVNLAPLETGNPFCEAKSELKFFEAALAGVPTIASPTGPYRRAIRHGETGFLASTPDDWKRSLERLVADAPLRGRVAGAARREVLWTYGPERRAEQVGSLLDLLRGGRPAALAFERGTLRGRDGDRARPVHVPDHEVVFQTDRLGAAEATVVVPLYNYARHVAEALDSAAAQTEGRLDLVVVDDRSTDESLAVVLDWLRSRSSRFNRVVVARNKANSGLAFTRNVGFDLSETPYVLPLDADNRLLPGCVEACLRAIKGSGAAYAYPTIQQFGGGSDLISARGYDPVRLSNGNYIDAMALVARAAWAAVGGYDHVRSGWEDFDFWCGLAEHGLRGEHVLGEPLAQYRVHATSMIQTAMTDPEKVRGMVGQLSRRHPWLTIVPPPSASAQEHAPAYDGDASGAYERLARLLPLLRCPEGGGTLAVSPDGAALVSEDGRRWPLVRGRPLLFPGMDAPRISPDGHVSNSLPDSALALIKGTAGPVLHLSAGGTAERFEHVVEAEAAVFRHTDVLADAHRLPFADGAFEAVVALNAFEHYREPRRAALEILRVLKPGGRVLVRTAFLQPLHEAPWHFFNCTRHGLEAWFEGFEAEALRVSDNFHPGHSLCWIASECEAALRGRVSDAAADAFLATTAARLVGLWRAPEAGRGAGDPVWSGLASLPQDAQEAIAAGFEFVGRRPVP
ncbi:hypothetical protein GCM10009416_04960 [Craurococcus roseus]|uniref:Glycosyltransferase n=1 Tax=Craurococcus roseus TaxID=77585 RepID=A0ABP3PKN3_9PROT